MPFEQFNTPVEVLDVSAFTYADRVCAAALQGLINREKPVLFLDYGAYDDPTARRTNEVFMDDEIWFGKYRAMLGNQDQHNLEYYASEYGIKVRQVQNLEELIHQYQNLLNGCVVWDAAQPDTVNIALMLAAQESLLPVESTRLEWVQDFGLEVKHDLRGCWKDRVELYYWAFTNLFSKCKPGEVACIEPGWQRPEFIDYVVQNKLFVFNLSSQQKGLGSTLLLLLAFGPAWLRELIFALRLEGHLRRLAVRWLGSHSDEVRLNNQIQQAVKSSTYPTIYGWHTRRDDELSFMLLLSANGLRLVPSHLAGNFSFHAGVNPLGSPVPQPAAIPELDPQGIYLTFTLSDGDQLMMMSTGELGNWYSLYRGRVPFNWEVQPLLVELAPALLEKYQRSVSPADCLIAGPSGAGYIIPPLAPDLPAYLRETDRICRKAGIKVVTTYVPDPPLRILRQLDRFSGELTGYLAGYASVKRLIQKNIGGVPLITNQVPEVSHIWDTADQVTAAVKKLLDAPVSTPRFIGVHLFAYRTSIDDIAQFAASIQNEHIHILRADVFLSLAHLHLQE